MKKKLNQVFSFVCLILVLCIALYYVVFNKTLLIGTKQDDVPQEGILMDTFTQDNQNTEPSSSQLSKAPKVDKQSGEDLTKNGDIAGEATTSTETEKTVQVSVASMSRETLRALSAGTILDLNDVGDIIMENCFYYEEIKDDIKSRIVGKSYKDNCTVPFDDLAYVRVLYYGFDEETHIGELIVNSALAGDIVAIFTELYEAKYTIEQMVLVDEYNADDNTSMAANNTSSFNYRAVPGSTHLSKHALGLAIDINPLYNPYVQINESEIIILPIEGTPYADRTLDCPYYINEDDLCYQTFTKYGFTWGGFWESEPDYQHFQKTID